MASNAATEFGTLLRHWREARHLSQLDLALRAEVSSKHVSFLETGRNRPSRKMILNLAGAMDVPLRDRNLMLSAAGFAGVYAESGLESPSIAQADEALRRLLEKQEPYPAIVMDADWMIVRQNAAAGALAGRYIDDPARLAGSTALELLFSPDGLQPWVVGWDRLGSVLLLRLFREAVSPAARASTRALFERLLTMPTIPANWRELAAREPAGPTLDLVLERGDLRCRFFTAVTTFGTPQDVTLQELRIELYFPADAETHAACRRWAESE